MIERLRSFASGPQLDAYEALSLLRLVYLAVFGLQLLVALLTGSVLAWLVPGAGAANDVLAIVLLGMALFHLPLGWLLGRAAIRAGGRQAALSGIISAAVLFSIPVWFGVLLLVSGQRPVYLMGIAALVSVGYSLGFLMTSHAAQVAANADRDGDPAADSATVRAADAPADEPDPAPEERLA